MHKYIHTQSREAEREGGKEVKSEQLKKHMVFNLAAGDSAPKGEGH